MAVEKSGSRLAFVILTALFTIVTGMAAPGKANDKCMWCGIRAARQLNHMSTSNHVIKSLCANTVDPSRCASVYQFGLDSVIPIIKKELEENCVQCDSEYLHQVPEATVDAECEFCKFFVSKIQKLLENNATIPAINATIYNECMAFVKSKITCLSVAGLAASVAKNIINKQLNPENACFVSGFCKKQGLMLDEHEGNSTKKCNVCMDVMTKLDDYLENNYIYIKGYMTKLCQKVVPPADKKCLQSLKSRGERKTAR